MSNRAKNRQVFSWITAIVPLFLFFNPALFGTADDANILQEQLVSVEESTFVTEALFKNGLKVLVNEHRSHPVVSIQAVIRTGLWNTADKNPGMKSLLAARFFERDYIDKDSAVQDDAQMLGAFLKSSVGYSHCSFEIRAPAPRWKRALDIHSGAVLNSSYDSEKARREIHRIKEEARRKLETPKLSALEGLIDLSFHSSISGRWTTILNEDFNAVSGEELARLHKTMFSPEKMILVIAGDVDASEVLVEVARLYGNLPGGADGGIRKSLNKSQENFLYRQMRGDSRNPHVLFGFHLPGTDSADYPALEVLHAILGFGDGSILKERIQKQKKLIFNGITELYSTPGFGFTTIQMKVPSENIDRSEIALLVELELLKHRELEDADMERAYAQLERAYRDKTQTVSGRARLLAQFEIEGDWKGVDRHLAELRKVQPEDVRRVASKYFGLEKLSLLEYLPEGEDTGRRSGESILRTLRSLLTPVQNEELVRREKEIVMPFDIPKEAADYRFSWVQYPFRTASILRGPEIYIREDHTTPLIHLGLFYPGGILHETGDNYGITRLMISLMLMVGDESDDREFYRQLEIYGGRVLPVVTRDYFGFYFSVPSVHFSEGFDLFMKLLKSPEFDTRDLRWHQSVLKSERTRIRNDADTLYTALYGKLFDRFPYSRIDPEADESLAGITAASLQAWYDRHVKNRKPLVVITGNSDGTSLASYFVRHFSGSRFLQAELPQEFSPALDSEESIESRWDKNRSLVAIGFQAPPVGDRNRPATRVLQNYLSIKADEGSKKFEELNSVHVAYEPALRGGSFIVYADVEPGGEDEVLEFLQEEIDKSVDAPYSFRDFRSAVYQAAGQFQVRQQDPFLQISDVALNILAGNGIEGYRSLREKLQSVQENDLRSAAEQVFRIQKPVRLRLKGRTIGERIPVSENSSELEN